MRRWTLLVAGAALWLFLAAIPALADGGPHVAKNNSGESTLTADSCAGCHRAHTAQASMLLIQDEEGLCLMCHGSAGVGATTDVELGIQYKVALPPGSPGQGEGDAVVAGALRAGGFVNARISASGNLLGDGSPVISRKSYPRYQSGVIVATSYSAQVPARATGQAVTSAHMHIAGTADVTGPGTAWGYGAANSGAGATVTLECASCHNPHGNNQYRILKKFTNDQAPPAGITALAAPGREVADVRTNPTGSGAAGTRNYTVKWGATLEDVVNGTYLNPDSATGDYWRRLQPYSTTPTGTAATPTGYFRGDIAEFVPGQTTTSNAWRTAISSWCSTCHSRYHTASVANGGFNPPVSPAGSYNTDSGDAIFKYRHGTSNSECTQCHVSHGSNAAMPGQGATTYSANYPYPDASVSASSRLLKVANRGTCQQCHDPTGTYLWNSDTFTPPVPLTVTH